MDIRDDSVGKALSVQAWWMWVQIPVTHVKSDVVTYVYTPMARWEAKRGESMKWKLAGHNLATSKRESISNKVEGKASTGGCPLSSTYVPCHIHICTHIHMNTQICMYMNCAHIKQQKVSCLNVKVLTDVLPFTSLALFSSFSACSIKLQ